jgi:hypothetical protein
VHKLRAVLHAPQRTERDRAKTSPCAYPLLCHDRRIKVFCAFGHVAPRRRPEGMPNLQLLGVPVTQNLPHVGWPRLRQGGTSEIPLRFASRRSPAVMCAANARFNISIAPLGSRRRRSSQPTRIATAAPDARPRRGERRARIRIMRLWNREVAHRRPFLRQGREGARPTSGGSIFLLNFLSGKANSR